ncbi:MAG: SMC-Scp complex subunit ScpB [Deltaproteobacteria bacterium]|nr:SMC-Scp complex subunit ScpB [Deltaproteobacteria bacterium]
MNRELLKSVVEGLIFAHSEPLNIQAISTVLQSVSDQLIQEILYELELEYSERSRGFVLARVAGGYQFRSLPLVAPWILDMKSIKPSRLSRAALETLSIIAYNQPITRSRIEKIRGVETAGTIKNLLDRELIVVAGRLDIPGRPLVYGTSRRFLEVFGLTDLSSLPPLTEIEVIPDTDS